MPRRSKQVIHATIQDAAIVLFKTKSYNEISMIEIAEKADISKGTLYKYFPSKIALFASIFEYYLRMFLDDELTGTYEDLSYAQTSKEMLMRLCDFTEQNEGFMRLFWMLNSESTHGEIPAELLTHINYWNTQILDKFTEMLRTKDATGLYKQLQPELITHVFSAINKGIYLQATKEEGLGIDNLNRQDLVEAFCNILIYCGE